MPSAKEQEKKSIEVTAAQSLPNDKQVVTEMYEYKPRNMTEVKDADPDFVYRWLSKKKIDREGGDTRGWELVQGNQNGHAQNPDANLERMLDDAKMTNKLPKEIPQQTGDQDTTRSLGDLILGRGKKEWAESRKKYYQDLATEKVDQVKVRDEKDHTALMEETLRKAGVSKSDTKRFLDAMGGAMYDKTAPPLKIPFVMNARR